MKRALRVSTLASDAATASFTIKITRCCWSMRGLGLWRHYNGVSHPPFADPCTMPAFELRKIAEADFPSRFGHFRILGFQGVEGNESEDAVCCRWAISRRPSRCWCASIRSA